MTLADGPGKCVRGAYVPLGYDVIDRKLIMNEAEAEQARTMFGLFARSDSTAAVIRELNSRGIRSKRGRPIDRGALYKLLHNRIYQGQITTIADLAAEEGLSDRYVSRLLRLAWLAPDVL